MRDYLKNFAHYTEYEAYRQDYLKLGKDQREDIGEIKRIKNRYHPKKINYLVSKIDQENKDTKNLRLKSVSGYLPPFVAGQFILIHLEDKGIKYTKAFYISSSPEERDYYDILVKDDPEDPISSYLYTLDVGDLLSSTSAFGYATTYNKSYQGKKLVFVASADHISPFLSVVKDQVSRSEFDLNIEIIDITGDKETAAYKNDLERLAIDNVNLHFVSPDQFSLATLKSFITKPEDYRYFVTGNSQEVKQFNKVISQLPIKDNHIKTDVAYSGEKELS